MHEKHPSHPISAIYLSDLHTQGTASTVANFLRMSATLGEGKNLKLFANRLEAMQDLRNRVSGCVDCFVTLETHKILC